MARDLKYGKVALEHGSIGEDEPVMVFRAQDELLPLVLDYYYDLCAEADSPSHHLDAIIENRRIVTEWQRKNHTRVPNSNEYHDRIAALEES